MMYMALLRNQWKCFVRSAIKKRTWLAGLGLLPLVLYVAFVLVGLGYFFNRLLDLSPGRQSLQVLNTYLLSAWLSTLALRFFFQRPPRMSVQPYLHLPIARSRLVRYYQAASLASLHNLYPLFFILPFWLKHVRHLAAEPITPVLWLTGQVLCIVLFHFANTWIRMLVDRHPRPMVGLLLAVVGWQLLDQAFGWDVLNRLSSWFFDGLATGQWGPFAALAVGTGAVIVASSRDLAAALRSGPGSAGTQRGALLPDVLRFGHSPIRNLVTLELMMMWRNKRSRQYVLISVGVSTAYTALLLSDFNAISGSLMAAAVGLFASGVFALNYGQLMFAWESRYFDGVLARDVAPQHLVLAKFMVLQGSCLVLFLISLPLFIWLARHLLMLHVAFLFYNAGVTSLLMLVLAVFNRKRVNATEGSFFNYQGFSILHWLWIIPTILPPAVLLFVLEATPETALALIAAMGLLSMLLAWPSSRLLARLLKRRKHLMAAGFRSYDY